MYQIMYRMFVAMKHVICSAIPCDTKTFDPIRWLDKCKKTKMSGTEFRMAAVP